MTVHNFDAHNFDGMRDAMVSNQLRTVAVNDVRVLEAMSTVPREQYVPESRRALAYADVSVPLEGGRAMPSPMAVGRLLTELQLRGGEKVLLVGAGTAYTAALLAALGAETVAVEQGDLTGGSHESAPYDVLIINGAVEAIPDGLAAQIRPGGKIACGLAENGVTRLAIGQRSGSGVSLRPFADVEIPILPEFARPKSFAF
jgi:protein-L-isoaspartate(D-aspartate) O-methyltransferase